MADRTLLLVDDEENILRALTRTLRRDGYTVLRANSGQAGLALLARNPVQVIISDQRMPEMTGTEFLSQVKGLHPDTVRMVLSGYTDLQSVTDAINEGAIYKFLTKPWDDELLRKNIQQAFEHYELRSENVRLARELQEANAELQRMNEGLQGRVAEQTQELRMQLRVLELSREILEHLPVAVIGVGSDGIVAVANLLAHQILGAAPGTLIGSFAQTSMPIELQPFCRATPGSTGSQASVPVELSGGAKLRVNGSSIAQEAGIQGSLLVLAPVHEQ